MRHPIRYQSQLLYRRSYKPGRLIRVRPARGLTIVYRPARNGLALKKSSFITN